MVVSETGSPLRQPPPRLQLPCARRSMAWLRRWTLVAALICLAKSDDADDDLTGDAPLPALDGFDDAIEDWGVPAGRTGW